MPKINYKISARATILLGREGVSKADGAMVELIKNTYDADADFCFLCIDKEDDTIYLFDNGTGMSSDVIKNCWMLIGTHNKRDDFKSKKNRIKSGEKGIGRFALDRLGSKCTMYTKTENNDIVLRWCTDWTDFEKTNKTLDEMQADLDELDKKFYEVIPMELRENIEEFVKKKNESFSSSGEKLISPFLSGTLFVINGLRDAWDVAFTNRFISGLGTLLPPAEQAEFSLCTMKNFKDSYYEVKNPFSEDYDYKLNVFFDGSSFDIRWNRNEFDINKIPDEVFERKEFKIKPYRKEDFLNQVFSCEVSISELMKTDDEELIKKIKQIGSFSFEYSFMKLTSTDDSNETFYYKEIGKNRAQWLKYYGGIKIYRDNFFVRPYGDPTADAYDWLGLDARRAKNPAGISHPNGGWHVRNKQGQGTVCISRLNNDVLLDKSSREGIIENEYFSIFKNVIVELLTFFERDRAYIGKAMKAYSDEVNQKAKAKEEGSVLAKKVLVNSSHKKNNEEQTDEEKLARTVQIYEEEREDLLSEIQQLKVLATSGLLTSTVAHDLKSLNAILVRRVKNLQKDIERSNDKMIERHVSDLMKNDQFLKSWLTIVATQARKDRRTRKKENIYSTIRNLVNVLEPILARKNVSVNIVDDGQIVERRIFQSDFESIIYNLIINSIEAFQKVVRENRQIEIRLSSDDRDIMIYYEDNGPGISKIFATPYDIFTYGTTSKRDKDGNSIGTGMGMYIVASTLREYSGTYSIQKIEDGFALEIKIPRGMR